jgi:hypothetical protein
VCVKTEKKRVADKNLRAGEEREKEERRRRGRWLRAGLQNSQDAELIRGQ